MTTSTRVAVLLSAVGVALSIVAITAIVVRVGLGVITGSSAWILVVAGIVPGLAAGAILLLGSPPPRTPWSVQFGVVLTVAAAMVTGVLSGITNLGLPIATLQVVSALLLLLALGLLFSQLFAPDNQQARAIAMFAPVAVGFVVWAIPATTSFFIWLAPAVGNLAIGLIVISPLFALSALVTGVNRARKEASRVS